MTLRIFLPLVSALALGAAPALAAETAGLRSKVEAEFKRAQDGGKASATLSDACVVDKAVALYPKARDAIASSARLKVMMKLLPARVDNKPKAEAIDDLVIEQTVMNAIHLCSPNTKRGSDAHG